MARESQAAIEVGSTAGRRANIASFTLTILGGIAQGWALISLGRALGALASTGTGATTYLAHAVVAAALAALSQCAASLVARQSSASEEAAIRTQGLRHLFALGPARSRAHRSGATISLLTDGVERIAAYRQTFLAPTLAAAATPAAVLLTLGAAVDWLTALTLLAGVALIPAFILRIHKKLRRSSSGSRRQRGRLAAEYLDAIQGLTTLTLARAATRTAERLRHEGENNRRAVMGLLAGNQLVIFLTDCLFSLFFVTAAAGLALTRLAAGAITTGDALAIVLVAYTILQPLDHVGAFFYVGMGGMANQRALRRLLATKIADGGAHPRQGSAGESEGLGNGGPRLGQARAGEPAGIAGGAPQSGLGGAADPLGRGDAGAAVMLDGVSAGWEAGRDVLREVNLRVHEGEHLAIVGPSGAGKSTLVALLSGDLQPSAGRLTVAGIEAAPGRADAVRSRSAVVAQSTWLFTGTIASNLRLADPQASDERLWEALEAANLADEVRRMPAGLSTELGEQGLGLSGGQAQRLALARAFLAGRPLLILDEPTSQVDLDSEERIVEAIGRIGRGRTVMTVSHRPGAIAQADRLVRVSGGRLEEVPEAGALPTLTPAPALAPATSQENAR